MANVPTLDLIVGHPSGAAVVGDYLENADAVAGFYGPHFSRLASFERKAEEVDRRFDRSARERAAEALLVPGGADPQRVERFVEEGGYMVTTGQQPALFGGPLYSVHKALTAVRLAEALEARLGRPVLPLFWVASDDHDWDEANHAVVIGVDNELHRVEIDPPDPSVRPSLHRVPLPDYALEEFLQHLPDTEFSSEYFELLRRSFTPGTTLSDGFHATLQHLLGRFGVLFTDAAHPAVKRDSAELLLAELDAAEAMESVLSGTAAELEKAGYSLQVPILEGGVNLFIEGPSGRERLYRENGGFRLRTSGALMSADEVRAAAAADPSVLSPNVLLRPVVESSLFPTLAYVGGPGEIGYFAQLKAYFVAHGIDMPVVYPRWGAWPVEGKIRKVLDKFGMDVDQLNRPIHEIAGDMARDEVPESVRAVLGKLRASIGAGAGELQAATKAVDPTLKGPVQHMRSQAFAAVDDVERKIVSAVKRETDINVAQLEKAQLHLFPLGKPAERVQSPMYFLARYGGSVLDALYERFAVNLD